MHYQCHNTAILSTNKLYGLRLLLQIFISYTREEQHLFMMQTLQTSGLQAPEASLLQNVGENQVPYMTMNKCACGPQTGQRWMD